MYSISIIIIVEYYVDSKEIIGVQRTYFYNVKMCNSSSAKKKVYVQL